MLVGNFKYTVVYIVFAVLSQHVHALELSGRLTSMVGTTFEHSGPNCFAMALYGSEVHDSLRGVSVREFEAVLDSSCLEVNEPQMGDIAVYSPKNFAPVHAYTYVDSELGFEKQGVDYFDPTPVRLQLQSNIDWVHMASKECRQWGDESCYAVKKYYRCSKPKYNNLFRSQLSKVNKEMDRILFFSSISSAIKLQLQVDIKVLAQYAQSDLEKAVILSMHKQMDFLKTEPLVF